MRQHLDHIFVMALSFNHVLSDSLPHSPAFPSPFGRYLFVASAELFPRPRLSSKTCRASAGTCLHVRGEWLVDIAPHYFDLANFPQGECRRVLERCARRRILRLSCCRESPCASWKSCLCKMSDESCGICAGYTSRRSGRWSASRLTRDGQRAPSTKRRRRRRWRWWLVWGAAHVGGVSVAAKWTRAGVFVTSLSVSFRGSVFAELGVSIMRCMPAAPCRRTL